MSQEELGALAALHRTEIGMLEAGTRLARVDTLMKLSGALSISPLELLDGIHWTPGNSAVGAFSITDRSLARRRGNGWPRPTPSPRMPIASAAPRRH